MILSIDFETFPIEPGKPWPEPVGVAIQIDGRPAVYRSWGHPKGSTYSKSAARTLLHQLVSDAERVVMYNAPFDAGVAREHLGLTIPWHKIDDVQILAFLHEPYADALDLKAVAFRQIGIPPEEQADLFAYIKENVKEAKGKRTKLGKYIAYADAAIVGPYARGDVLRTYKLWRSWAGLRKTKAYAREMALLPVLDDMTRTGMPLDHAGIERDIDGWMRALAHADTYLRRLLGADVNLKKHDEICDRLEKKGLVKEWITTKNGKRSLAYDALVVLVAEGKFDRRFAEAWGYRSVLSHTLTTFASPWLKAGVALHPQWNGTRQERGGARTGRLSSTPNIQNIIKNPPRFAVPVSWPALPRMRHYVLAPRGMRLAGADISQQELRVLAHAVGEPLIEWYRADPTLDLHVKVSQLISEITGLALDRGITKAINFSKIYGAGVAKLASQLKRTHEEAHLFRNAHTQALPGIKRWERRLAAETRFSTVGGREYCHDPERPYKSGNTFIQGSSADQAKEIMILAQPVMKQLGGSLCSMAHDEFVALVPATEAKRARDILLATIEATGYGGARAMFEVPMRGEGYVRTRWQE